MARLFLYAFATLALATGAAAFGGGELWEFKAHSPMRPRPVEPPTAPVNPCRPNPCGEHCDCVDIDGEAKCNCLKPEPLNPCRPNPCPPGRECIDVRGKAECIRPSKPTKSPTKSPTKVCFSR